MKNSDGSQDANWSKFGLTKSRTTTKSESEEYKEEDAKENELFNRDPENKKKPWWKTNFLLTESVQFGTWDGVFTSCMINIFGVVIFLRTGWMVGFAGLGLSVLIIILTMIIALIAILSAIGLCERCKIESGGVYFLLSHVLGSRVATSVGFLYCFGQAVASSLYASGFGESISSLLGYTNPWIAKGIGVGILIILLGVNLTGVKWVIRLQLLLLLILFIAVLDFLVGSFVKRTPSLGVVGYSIETFRNNTHARFTHENTFFSVFGVFFPTATGVCAGINMSGDLRNPKKSIPLGTLSAIGVSFVLYMCFAIALGGTCTPEILQKDNMITAKVAFLGPLLLFGLYVSSLSAALGGITTAPRLLKVIAETTKLPGTAFLGRHFGKNKVPVFSLLIIVSITISFIFIGNINILGPIVTTPFLMTYATLSYAYFVLAKSFDIRKRREDLFKAINHSKQSKGVKVSHQIGVDTKSGSNSDGFTHSTGSNLENSSLDKEYSSCEELDRLFPERISYGATAETNSDNSFPKINKEIIKQPRSFYSIFINRWISLFGTFMFILLMFGVEWTYSLIGIGIWFLLYIYIGYVTPGLFPGVAEFSILSCISHLPSAIRSRNSNQEREMLISKKIPEIVTEPICVTDESLDYIDRGKYHQAQKMDKDRVIDALAGVGNNK
uniref:Solute carrier family 12 member 9 n=1 Tax=Schmidtea mediterranea TaxID=79327 RepID=A0A0H3YJ24_SCHMD|nr:slc12a-5 [Schmidtea mediterranea]